MSDMPRPIRIAPPGMTKRWTFFRASPTLPLACRPAAVPGEVFDRMRELNGMPKHDHGGRPIGALSFDALEDALELLTEALNSLTPDPT